jgi:hypothetical protein
VSQDDFNEVDLLRVGDRRVEYQLMRPDVLLAAWLPPLVATSAAVKPGRTRFRSRLIMRCKSAPIIPMTSELFPIGRPREEGQPVLWDVDIDATNGRQ